MIKRRSLISFYCEVVEVATSSELVSSVVGVATLQERTCESIEFNL